MRTFISISLLVFLFCPVSGQTQSNLPYNIISVEPSEGVYIITYYNNPVGDEPDADYEVSVRLLRESAKDFSMPMKFVSGDVGDGHFVGSALKISWDYKRQFPQGIPYDDIVFELTVVKDTGGGGWLYYVGGAAVLGGGAAVLLGKKTTTTSTGTEIPALTASRPQ